MPLPYRGRGHAGEKAHLALAQVWRAVGAAVGLRILMMWHYSQRFTLPTGSVGVDLRASIDNNYYNYTLFPPKGKVRPADKQQLKIATILPMVEPARSKQDPINCGHGAQ